MKKKGTVMDFDLDGCDFTIYGGGEEKEEGWRKKMGNSMGEGMKMEGGGNHFSPEAKTPLLSRSGLLGPGAKKNV